MKIVESFKLAAEAVKRIMENPEILDKAVSDKVKSDLEKKAKLEESQNDLRTSN